MPDEIAAELAKQVQASAAGETEPEVDETNRGDEIEAEGVEEASAKESKDVVAEPADEDTEVDNSGAEQLAGAETTPARDNRIPLSRFNAVNDRYKDAAKKVADLEEQLRQAQLQSTVSAAPASTPEPAAPSAEQQLLEQNLKVATRQHATAVAENNIDEAVEAQLKVAEIQQKLIAAKQAAPVATPQAAPSVDDAVAEIEFRAALKEMKAAHSALDETSKNFDEPKVMEVNRLWNALSATGTSKADALRSAVDYVFPDVSVAGGTSKPTEAQTRRNVQNAQNAAPDISKAAGEVGGGAINYKVLSDEDFAALPESKKKEDRGDFL